MGLGDKTISIGDPIKMSVDNDDKLWTFSSIWIDLDLQPITDQL